MVGSAVLSTVLVLSGCAAAKTPETPERTDIAYGHDSAAQVLDLYRPADTDWPVPLVIYIHGGGWSAGDKSAINDARMTAMTSFKNDLLDAGYAVAAINYRLTPEAIWPAQIFDVKGAVRYLSANAKKYGLDPRRFAAFGDSAGGHLVGLLTTTGGLQPMEGTVGGTDGSSAIKVGISYFGPFNLPTMQPEAAAQCGDGVGEVGQSALIGGPITTPPYSDAAALASPVTHVDASDAPLLLLHGTTDCVVAYAQSDEMHAKLEAAGVPTALISRDVGHSDPIFFTDDEIVDQVLAFISEHL